jgi:hypothetical protein
MSTTDTKSKKIILVSGSYNRWFLASKNYFLKEDPLHWDHIDPALPAPALPGAPGAALTRFRKSEATTSAEIINTIDEANFTRVQHIFEDATRVSPARDVWLALRDHHNHQSATIQTTCKRLLNASFFAKQRKDMTGWLTYNQTIYNRLIQHGGTLTPREFIIDLVGRLPDSPVYLTYQTMVKMRPDGVTMTIDHVTHELVSLAEDQSEVLQEEKSTALFTDVLPPAYPAESKSFQDFFQAMVQSLATTSNGSNGNRHNRDNQSRSRGPGNGAAGTGKGWRTPAQVTQLKQDVIDGICNLFRHGRCDKGESCKFRHLVQANVSTSVPSFSFALCTITAPTVIATTPPSSFAFSAEYPWLHDDHACPDCAYKNDSDVHPPFSRRHYVHNAARALYGLDRLEDHLAQICWARRHGMHGAPGSRLRQVAHLKMLLQNLIEQQDAVTCLARPVTAFSPEAPWDLQNAYLQYHLLHDQLQLLPPLDVSAAYLQHNLSDEQLYMLQPSLESDPDSSDFDDSASDSDPDSDDSIDYADSSSEAEDDSPSVLQGNNNFSDLQGAHDFELSVFDRELNADRVARARDRDNDFSRLAPFRPTVFMPFIQYCDFALRPPGSYSPSKDQFQDFEDDWDHSDEDFDYAYDYDSDSGDYDYDYAPRAPPLTLYSHFRDHVRDRHVSALVTYTGPGADKTTALVTGHHPASFDLVCDSGCTDNIFTTPALVEAMVILDPAPNVTVWMNATPVPAKSSGYLDLDFQLADGTWEYLRVYGLSVTDSHHNLFSNSEHIRRHSGTISCSDTGCTIINSDGTAGPHATPQASLYVFKVRLHVQGTGAGHRAVGLPTTATSLPTHEPATPPMFAPSLAVAPLPPPLAMELHSRLGHVALDTLKTMLRAGTIQTSVDIKESILRCSDLRCQACAHSAVNAAPKPAGSTKEDITPVPVGRLDSDAAGPFSRSRAGYTWVTCWIHVATRYTFLGLHSNKVCYSAFFAKARPTWEAIIGNPITVLRTDNGGEFTSKIFNEYCASTGVRRELTAPYSSFQNGKSERKMRTLRGSATAMLVQSGLPSSFWAEAYSYANYLRNRLPCAALNGISPYQAIHGVPPNLFGAHPFGCLAYTKLPSALRVKGYHAPTARMCVYLGPDVSTKDAGRFLHVRTGKTISTRSARYDDMMFPLRRSPDVSAQPVFDQLAEVTPEGPIGASIGTSFETALSVPPSVQDPAGPAEIELADALIDMPDFRPALQEELHPNDAHPPAEGVRYPARIRAAPALLDLGAYDAQRQHDQARVIQAHVTTFNEPSTYAQAMAALDSDKWLAAVQVELAAHRDNNTWSFARLPFGRQAIPSRWVFKVKIDSAGNPVRWKARMVARGDRQREGVDYSEVFAPALRWVTFRYLCALAALKAKDSPDARYCLHQMDVVSAYLNANLTETIYMLPPKDTDCGVPPGHVLKLNKSLYGLRQSGKCWHQAFDHSLRSLGFTPSDADPCLYTRGVGNSVTAALGIFCDDTVILAPESDMPSIKAALHSLYKMTDGGPLEHFLGVRIRFDIALGVVTLDQSAYITDILRRSNSAGFSPISTPAETRIVTPSGAPDQEELLFMTTISTDYRSTVGALLYLSNCTRPDVAFTVNQLARYMAVPRRTHWLALKRLLRYLTATVDYGLRYTAEGESTRVTGYSDADFAGDLDTRRSTTGMVFMMANAAISWKSTSQKSVALSTCEAETVALSETLKEAIWLKRLRDELQPALTKQPLPLREDNQSAIALAKERRFSNRTKHIDIRHFFIREQLDAGNVALEYCPTADMLADIFTKALARTAFERLRPMLGVVRINAT